METNTRIERMRIARDTRTKVRSHVILLKRIVIVNLVIMRKLR